MNCSNRHVSLHPPYENNFIWRNSDKMDIATCKDFLCDQLVVLLDGLCDNMDNSVIIKKIESISTANQIHNTHVEKDENVIDDNRDTEGIIETLSIPVTVEHIRSLTNNFWMSFYGSSMNVFDMYITNTNKNYWFINSTPKFLESLERFRKTVKGYSGFIESVVKIEDIKICSMALYAMSIFMNSMVDGIVALVTMSGSIKYLHYLETAFKRWSKVDTSFIDNFGRDSFNYRYIKVLAVMFEKECSTEHMIKITTLYTDSKITDDSHLLSERDRKEAVHDIFETSIKTAFFTLADVFREFVDMNRYVNLEKGINLQILNKTKTLKLKKLLDL